MLPTQQIGASHAIVKQARNLIRNAGPNPQRLFVAEGLWAHQVLLDAATQVQTFLFAPEAAESAQALRCAEQVCVQARSSYVISGKTLTRISDRDKPDGLVSIAYMPRWDVDQLPLGDVALVVVADAIEIPGNLGTLIRTMDACGADCLVLTNRRTRLTHPKVFRGSRGMSLTMPIVEFAELTDAIEWLEKQSFHVLVADANVSSGRSYRDLDYAGRTAFVFGNERYGVSRPWFERGFQRVAIPMLGTADSLNVAASAAVLLYEARARQSRW